MKRRAFFGFLGGAAVAGPSVAKSAAQMTLSDLNLRQAGVAMLGSGLEAAGSQCVPADPKTYATKMLERLMGKTPVQIAREKADYHINGLDPEIASLRSVALQSKIRMTRAADYERSVRTRKTYFEGILAGWWE